MSLNVLDTMGRSMRDLRISVTDRCNFRCPYCMPAEIFGEAYEFLPREEILTFEEITRLTGLFAEFGVTKARITGGEPLLRTDLPQLISQIAAVEGITDVTLTTNGYLLSQQAQELKDSGLHRITVSLDSIDDEVFKQMNGRGFGAHRVLHAIQRAAEVGLTPVKINAVVQMGVNDHTIVDLARHFKGTGHIVRFIEYMDVGNRNGWKLDEVVSADEIIARIDAEMPLEPAPGNYHGEVAERYLYRDGSGEIGVIASVTRPSAAPAPASGCPPTVRYSPACSPPAEPACATPCATAPPTTNCATSSPASGPAAPTATPRNAPPTRPTSPDRPRWKCTR